MALGHLGRGEYAAALASSAETADVMDRSGFRHPGLLWWEADHIEARLKARGHRTEQRIIKTQGDRVQDLSFDKMEGKGFFTKEIESELLAGTVDLAIHSCKDLETRDPEGLHIAAIAGRAACEELLIIRTDAVDAFRVLSLGYGAVVGTSSVVGVE